jgi:hypothetical protein
MTPQITRILCFSGALARESFFTADVRLNHNKCSPQTNVHISRKMLEIAPGGEAPIMYA